MKLSNIVIVPKISKYDYDIFRYKLTPNELIKKYNNEGINSDIILESHERQKQALDELKKMLPESSFVARDYLTKEIAKKAELVIAFGGDNHFQYVSHFIDETFILGINSDPKKSEGALSQFSLDEFKKFRKNLENDDFKVEEWTRLQVLVNNKDVGLAVGEVFLGESERRNMSRHTLEFKNKKEEQKGSGLLVTTGAGSTGWYNSSCRYLYPEGNKFAKNSNFCKFLVTEPYRGKLSGYSMLNGQLKKGEELIIHSLNDSNGIASLDSLEVYDFNRGAIVKIKLGKTLKTITN